MHRKHVIPSNEDLFRAEKQVFAGIFGRLYVKYVQRYEQDDASLLALAIARILLSMQGEDERIKTFIERNQDRIRKEIMALRDETEIRRMVTDTMVMRVIAFHKRGGCDTDKSIEPVDRIKTLGIYLEGKQPPTPGSFVRKASSFFSSSPVAHAIPGWNG